jgi:hypothetical protein
MNPPPSPSARLAQRLEEQLPVLIAPENGLPPIPSGHDMIESPRILNANAARHKERSIANLSCQELMPDPLFFPTMTPILPYHLEFTLSDRKQSLLTTQV